MVTNVKFSPVLKVLTSSPNSPFLKCRLITSKSIEGRVLSLHVDVNRDIERVSEIGISYNSTGSDYSLALAQIRHLIYLGIDNGGLSSKKTNKIVFTSKRAYDWCSKNQSINGVDEKIIKQLYMCLQKYKFSFFLYSEDFFCNFPTNIILLDSTIDEFNRRSIITTSTRNINISIAAHGKLLLIASELNLDKQRLLEQILSEYDISYRTIVLTSSNQFFGENILSLAWIEKLNLSVVFSRSSNCSFTLVSLGRNQEDTFIGANLSRISNVAKYSLVMYTNISCHNVRKIPSVPSDGHCKNVVKMFLNIVEDENNYIFYYKLSIVESFTTQEIKSDWGARKFYKNEGEFQLSEGLWACLYPYIFHINSEFLELTCNNAELVKSVNTSNFGKQSNLYLSWIRTRFSSLYALMTNSFIPFNTTIQPFKIDGYNDDSFKRIYNVVLGKVLITHHALMRFIQREIETNENIWSRPLVKLKNILTGSNWRELAETELIDFHQTDDSRKLYLSDSSGWMIILAENQIEKVLVTILNINSPYFRRTSMKGYLSHEDFSQDFFSTASEVEARLSFVD